MRACACARVFEVARNKLRCHVRCDGRLKPGVMDSAPCGASESAREYRVIILFWIFSCDDDGAALLSYLVCTFSSESGLLGNL